MTPNPYEEEYQRKLKERREAGLFLPAEPPTPDAVAGVNLGTRATAPSIPNPYEEEYQQRLREQEQAVAMPSIQDKRLGTKKVILTLEEQRQRARERRAVEGPGPIGPAIERGLFGPRGAKRFLADVDAASALYGGSFVDAFNALKDRESYGLPGKEDLTRPPFELRNPLATGRETIERQQARGFVPRLLSEFITPIEGASIIAGTPSVVRGAARGAGAVGRGVGRLTKAQIARAGADLSDDDFAIFVDRLVEAEGDLPGGVAGVEPQLLSAAEEASQADILAAVASQVAAEGPFARLTRALGPNQTQFGETLTPKQALMIYHGKPFGGTTADALAAIRRLYPRAITPAGRVRPEYALDDVVGEYGQKYTQSNGVELLLRDIEAAKVDQREAITQRVKAARLRAEAPAAAVAKEPWQMTRAEFAAGKSLMQHRNDILMPISNPRSHYAQIVRALNEGKSVPPEVLAEWLDLPPRAAVGTVPEQVGAIQAGMGIGEPPAQGTLGLGGRIGAQEPVPLIDAAQVAERQRLAAERAAGQAGLPETAGGVPQGVPAGRVPPVVSQGVPPPAALAPSPAAPVPPGQPPVPPVSGISATGGAAPAPRPAGFRFTAPLRDFASVQGEVVTSDNPIIRGLAGRTGINPSVLQNTPTGKAIVAFQRQMVAGQELTDTAVSAALDTHAQRGTGRLVGALNIDNNGIVRGTGKRWEDVFSRPGGLTLSLKQKAYIDDYHQVVNEVEALRVGAGLKPRAKTGSQGWFYVPRQVKGIRGIELQRPSNPSLQRIYDEATDGAARGIDYSNNPRANLEIHVRAAYREIAEKQLSDALEPLSIPPKALVPDPVRVRLVTAITRLRTAEREARRQIQATAVGVQKAPMPSTFARKTAQFPEVITARTEYNTAKHAYSRAMESARKAEIARPGLFGPQQTDSIAIVLWRNRFFPREDAQELARAVQSGAGRDISPWVRGLEFTGNHTRFLAAVGDFAAPFTQGAPVLARNPVVWSRATFNHYLAFVDPTVQSRFIRDHLPDIHEMAQYGIPIGDPEFFAALRPGQGASLGAPIEAVFGRTARETAQQLGRQTAGRFQASYNTFLGESRTLLWGAMKSHWQDKAELASLVRNMTGGLDSRALGVLPSQRAVEGMWLAFSPRLLRSTLALISDVPRLGTQRGRESARIIAQLMAGAVGIYVATGVALGKSDDEIKQGLNPLNGKRFLSHQINGDWIGIGGQVRAVSQLVAKSFANPRGFTTIDQFENPIINFYMMRGAPAVNIVGGVVEAAGGNVLPFEQIDSLPDLAKHIGTSALPFAVQGILEGQEPLTTGASLGGVRTSAESPREEAQRYEVGKVLPPKDTKLQVLKTAYYQAGEGLLSEEGRKAWRKYEPLPSGERKLLLPTFSPSVQDEINQIEGYRESRRKKLATSFPTLDVLLVEEEWNARPQRSYTPKTTEGVKRLAALRGKKLGGGTAPFQPQTPSKTPTRIFQPSGVPGSPGLLGR